MVSSDHEVANAARAAGAFVIGAPEFRAKLHERPSRAAALAFKELDRGEAEVVKRSKDKAAIPQAPRRCTQTEPATQGILNSRRAFSLVSRPMSPPSCRHGGV